MWPVDAAELMIAVANCGGDMCFVNPTRTHLRSSLYLQDTVSRVAVSGHLTLDEYRFDHLNSEPLAQPTS
jgi:hypothetical protein